MPYRIGKDSSCPTGKPHAVKKVDGGVVPGGCHETRDQALKHLAALEANVTSGLLDLRLRPGKSVLRGLGLSD